MKNARAAALLLLLVPTGCDRHPDAKGDAGTTAAAAAPSSAPVEAKHDDVPSLSGFEGEIALVAKGKESPAPVPFNLLVRNDTLRFDVPMDLVSNKEVRTITGGGRVYAILRPADKKAFVVLDAKQQAVVLDLDSMGDKVKAMRPHGGHGGSDTAGEPPKITKTGRKETVAGYACEDWDIQNADRSRATVCVAEIGASFFHFPLTGIPTEHAWALELADGKHFPLKGVAYNKDGTEEGRLEVTKLDKHKLDASQFEVPMNYKQLSIEEMLGGLGGQVPRDMPRGMPHGGHHGKHHNQ